MTSPPPRPPLLPVALPALPPDLSPLTRLSPSVHTVAWPADRFYWAVVDAPGGGWKRRGEVPPALLSPLADELPLELDAVHAICVPLDSTGTSVALCAVSRDALATLESGVLRLEPAGLPEFIEGDVDPWDFNLLVGEFEPVSIRRGRFRSHLRGAAAVLLCAALVTVGLERRASAWRAGSTRAAAASTALIAQAGPSSSGPGLSAELARLRQQRQALGKISPPVDVSVSLAAFLGTWPATVAAKPQSFAIGDSTATLSVSLEGDPSAFLRAMSPPTGWNMEDPRLNTSGDLTRLTLQFREKPKGAKP